MNRIRKKALEGLLVTLVGILVRRLTPELLKSVVDKLLDLVEDAIDKSETQTDDALVEPIIAAIRRAFEIPDNDEPDEDDGDEPTVPMDSAS